MKKWKLGQDGYIMQYMAAGPVVQPFQGEAPAGNQLLAEAALRRAGRKQSPERRDIPVPLVGEQADIGARWEVQASVGDCFLDRSAFYSTLQEIRMEAAAMLWTDRDRQVEARLWTYMAVAVYCNGKKAGETDTPVYKPMHGKRMQLQLRKGANLLLFCCENLGARDTRNILGMQILNDTEHISVSLPDGRYQDSVCQDMAFLAGVRISGEKLVFPENAPAGARLLSAAYSYDYARHADSRLLADLRGKTEQPVPDGIQDVCVEMVREQYELKRHLQLADRIRPLTDGRADTREEAWHKRLSWIASVESLNRGEFGFSMMNLLARKATGTERAGDRQLFLDDLALIERRVDCADFLLCGLIRYLHLYGQDLDEKEHARVKEVLLHFRYWMNEKGTDAMCFWSENHSLMFYQAAMFAGEWYPEDTFVRAEKTGKELAVYAEGKVLQWLEDVERYGFEEFLSSVYMCVTFAALLNLVDYAEPSLAGRAEALTDRLLRELSLHAFRGTVIAPMGRVYGGVIYPFREGTQSLLHLADPSAPDCYGEGWTAFLAGSRYHFPEELSRIMKQPASLSYSTGNALVTLEKTDRYCLTSVQSPRKDGWKRWENIWRKDQSAADTHVYNKSMNESFHGTSCFAPGTYGYQQHMWTAALSADAIVFLNHPGTTASDSELRPGYWYGNGVMPALQQKKNRLGVIYRIPEENPVHFVHLYCPRHRFDEEVQRGHWLFLRKKNEEADGYLGIWISGQKEPYLDIAEDCEYRIYGTECACFVLCGDQKQEGSFEAFQKSAEELHPAYRNNRLDAGDFHMTWERGTDDTQYID